MKLDLYLDVIEAHVKLLLSQGTITNFTMEDGVLVAGEPFIVFDLASVARLGVYPLPGMDYKESITYLTEQIQQRLEKYGECRMNIMFSFIYRGSVKIIIT